MTKKQAAQYYKDFKERNEPVVKIGGRDAEDLMVFIAGMRHALVLLGVKHTELE